MPLSTAARQRLLALARDSIRGALEREREKPDPPSEPGLDRSAGAFVSLHRAGNLRGCIGNFHADRPLYRTVAEMARAAALRDPRFPPLTADELDEVEIEVSVLSPLRPIRSPEEIEVGRHGIYLVHGGHRGVLLPQVATAYGWDRVEFLEQTCRKAGLSPNAWREGTELYVFEAEVFGEGEEEG